MLSTVFEVVGVVGFFVMLVVLAGWLVAGCVLFAGLAVLGFAMGES